MSRSVRKGGRNWSSSQRMRRWWITAVMPKWADYEQRELRNASLLGVWAACSRNLSRRKPIFSCSSPPLRLPPSSHCIRANPMAIHGLWLGPGCQHVGTYDCSFLSWRSGHAVVGGGRQHSSVCIWSGLLRIANKDQGITFSPFTLDRCRKQWLRTHKSTYFCCFVRDGL